MRKNSNFGLQRGVLFWNLFSVCMTWTLAMPFAVAEDAGEHDTAIDQEEITIVVDDCEREILVPASKRDVRIHLPVHSVKRCQDRVSRDHMSDEEVGSWYAVGVDSCLVPFASELERIDCRTRLLRQRYSEATARYKERVRQSIYNNYWTD